MAEHHPETPPSPPAEDFGFVSRVTAPFLHGLGAPLLIAFALCLGAAAVLLTPREEEPQIVVPMADIMVRVPGASALEVERLVTTPLERILWQISGVEHVYAMARRDMAMATVRFFVGEDREASLIKLHNAVQTNLDLVPGVVMDWSVKPREIDDVPILVLVLHSDRYDDHALRRMAEELFHRLAAEEDVSKLFLVGGRPREVRVELAAERLAGFGVTIEDVLRTLRSADAAVTAGSVTRQNTTFSITADAFLLQPGDLGQLVVGVREGRPVTLSDVAAIVEGPAEPVSYSRLGTSGFHGDAAHPAVTLAIAKKPGANAVAVAQRLRERLGALLPLLPDDVAVEIMRDYGRTAQQKVDELLASLVFAIGTVVALLAVTMGRREALVVAVSVPVSFSFALFCSMLLGYSINRVTLFALILSLGLVVDDPITNVDNIQRHILKGVRRPFEATLAALREVLPPVLLSTVAIIISFAPMLFITGMMGPYMAPMAANVPLAVIFSTVAALTVVPWLSYHLLKGLAPAPGDPARPTEGNSGSDATPAWIRRTYHALMAPLLGAAWRRWALFGGIGLLLIASLALAAFRLVPLKMLPFDNKDELQLVLDFPEGTSLETTDRALRDFEDFLAGVPEIEAWTTYAGTASPIDFNGLVRQYYLRDQPHQADIRIRLSSKDQRPMQSHALALRIRRPLEQLAASHGAALKLVESPPGPPVLATVAAAVTGTPQTSYETLIAAAGELMGLMRAEPGVTDVDASFLDATVRRNFVIDKQKAALHGVTSAAITETLRTAVGGTTAAAVHLAEERQPLAVQVMLPRWQRASLASLTSLPVRASSGAVVSLGELGRFETLPEDQPILHKNLERVVWVYAEMAGRAPGEAILDLQAALRQSPLPPGVQVDFASEGEWQITLQVFRDLGLAFGAALLGIYILLILQTNSFSLPLLIMTAIPLTLLGILPGFWMLNAFFTQEVGGFSTNIFFTATSMIGMIALGGIVIRNSVVLLEFIEDSLRQGLALREAILESGAVRFRPIVLTALTTALGAWPITLDPIFSGLAWALIFGLAASTAFTLVVVPVAFFMYRRGA
ncbi:efflux RND transporter permease subunit [Megalodesulfovibrio gigas]|uniref:Putative acriflavin resistance protein n=1 Tax=Megalodesulfovibrio gigas (strain ATCC 19364 / DSM 1382 / NCIMB 9332 / VKM B-1759) TaxID=1121448 RepID=T2GET2_MEGG1|nr:efflux RND transporter permease subunit [Megalodesulfovibrio gigas]AGW14442.1 putative acriflavin resistance protein [Megalodesulfovibrio gigas DSM 1382 = ATCC 19364]